MLYTFLASERDQYLSYLKNIFHIQDTDDAIVIFSDVLQHQQHIADSHITVSAMKEVPMRPHILFPTLFQRPQSIQGNLTCSLNGCIQEETEQ